MSSPDVLGPGPAPLDGLADLVGCYEALADLMAEQDQRQPALVLLWLLNRRYRQELDVLDRRGGGLLS